jgi:hypothetical protein
MSKNFTPITFEPSPIVNPTPIEEIPSQTGSLKVLLKKGLCFVEIKLQSRIILIPTDKFFHIHGEETSEDVDLSFNLAPVNSSNL